MAMMIPLAFGNGARVDGHWASTDICLQWGAII